jgi:hypothetical protein
VSGDECDRRCWFFCCLLPRNTPGLDFRQSRQRWRLTGRLLQRRLPKQLMLAIATARNEYAFLHFEARRLKIDEAVNRNSSLFDQEAAARLRLPALANLAEATPEIVSFDRVTSFQDRRHSWILAVPQKPLPASAKLIQAATQVETRFATLDPFIQGA